MDFCTATIDDMNGLIKMRIAYISDEQQGIKQKDEQAMLKKLPEYFFEHLGKDLIVFVAKENNEIVATAFLLVVKKPSNPNFINGLIGNVLNVYTLPQYRKQGICTQLMGNLIKFAREHRLDFVELKATKEGYSLYKKMGFNEHFSEYKDMKLFL